MKATFTRRQMLKLLTASSVGASFANSHAVVSRLAATSTGITQDGDPRGAVPGVVPGISSAVQSREKVLAYLKERGHGSYLFGQVATWVHNENPDMDHPRNWIRKVYEHTGRLPRYGCITYDFDD